MNTEKTHRKSGAGITMEDLAVLAGVSPITVSRALRNSPLVTDQTRDKVRRIASEQGYRMNVSARNLRLGRSNTVAVVLEMQPASLALLGGIAEVLTGAGYAVILGVRALLDTAAVRGADGVIVLDQRIDAAGVERLRQGGSPLLLWNAVDPQAASLTADGALLGRRMLALLD
ncbi:LacI family DNA-binding transcriptional regulator [Massilia sp. Mn16-1_5]|uniref:LacI family DNA-binding transcriptional regulator n=1 Tax=Massilia sp. Mn16-1_5 TaxID=2079199 RepID=UPI001E3B8625|nr:LacI family DNA-binding transcriptional regulator [Massilia sp. Mn16-1_5]